VEISFKTKKLEKQCNEDKEMLKIHGPERARKLKIRLDDLRASPNLQSMKYLPGRSHELKGNRAGELAIDLDHPYRLIFKPVGEHIYKKDGGLDWNLVTSIIVISIEDYHE